LDCHSFASVALPYEFDQSEGRPEICLGTDSFHTPDALRNEARRIFEEAGFRVSIDRPFSGALVPAASFQRDRRVLALMIEVNRGLYMDEEAGERLTNFAHTKRRLGQATTRVVRIAADAANVALEF
jgi:N-formylglutamate amidohydrolase